MKKFCDVQTLQRLEDKMTSYRQSYKETGLFGFIWHFLKPHKLVVATFVLLALAAGLWSPFNSMIIKRLIDLLPTVKNGDVSILKLPTILLIINFIVFENITWRGIGYIWAKYVPVCQNRITVETLDYVLSHSNEFYQHNLSGKLSKQIGNLVDGITRIITFTSANFLRASSLLIAGFITAYFANPIFCIILVTWFAVFIAFGVWTSKRTIVLSDELASEESILSGELVDSLSNHSNVRIFSGRLYESLRMTSFFAKYQQSYTKTYLYSTIINCIQGGLIAIMITCSSFSLIYLYGKRLITVGDFGLILTLCMDLAFMMWWMMSELDEFNKAIGKSTEALESLMLPLEIVDKPDARTLNCTEGRISFRNVKFDYSGTSASQAGAFFENSIEIEPGQKVGLVGYSGAGKSTFVNLILRLYDIGDGAILVDDQDIRDVTQDSLRKNIGMIPQDPSLFNRSLMENIRYGRIDATDDEVVEAAKKAHAHEFIDSLPQGYNSLVGERGVKLSGGQRQRIAIARAILKNAPILILDEATSQLDSVTENLIQESVWNLMQNSSRNENGGKTTLVIAHRLSTLLNMDRILAFDKGKIEEDGTHTELLAKNGVYKKLWDAQVGGFLGDSEMGEQN